MKIKVLHSETQAEVKELDLAQMLQEGESCFVGRSQNSGLVLDSPNISRLHGKFSCEAGQYYFCDLGSSNGSMVRDEIAVANQNYLLQPGDVLRVGEFILQLESTPEEELSLCVVNDSDAAVTIDMPNALIANEDIEQVIEAEWVQDESSALVKIHTTEIDHTIQGQTQALFAAINRKVLNDLRITGDFTRETYLRAVHKARASIEQDRRLDPEQFEKEAEKYWKSITKNTSAISSKLGSVAAKGASDLGGRLGAAAKAAWNEFITHRSHPSEHQDAELNSEPNAEEKIVNSNPSDEESP